MSRRRFTLVELLVVMAVIALLAGLVLGAVGQARQKARATACISQLRQVGLAVHLYLDESEDHLPFASRLGPEAAYNLPSLPQCLATHIGDPMIFHCPGDNGPESLFTSFATSYEWNTFVSGKQISQPSMQIVGLSFEAPILSDGEAFHGEGRRNLLFSDGHVQNAAEINLE